MTTRHWTPRPTPRARASFSARVRIGAEKMARLGIATGADLAAKLVVALLIEEFVYRAESFSPWGYPIPPGQQLAHDTASA